MRAIISPSGSFIPIAPPSLPARLDQARDQPLGAEIPKRDARQPVLAVVAARPTGHLATIANAGRRRVARQLRELQGRRESLLHRPGLVASNGPEPSAPAGILLAQLAPPIVLLDRTLLCHQCLLAVRRCGCAHCRNGKLNALSSARASLSVFALVHTVMSIPQTSATLS